MFHRNNFFGRWINLKLMMMNFEFPAILPIFVYIFQWGILWVEDFSWGYGCYLSTFVNFDSTQVVFLLWISNVGDCLRMIMGGSMCKGLPRILTCVIILELGDIIWQMKMGCLFRLRTRNMKKPTMIIFFHDIDVINIQ